MPRAVPSDFVKNTGNCATFATCSYAPDQIFGAQVELSHGSAKLAVQGSLLERSTPLASDVVRSADRISDGQRLVRALGSRRSRRRLPRGCAAGSDDTPIAPHPSWRSAKPLYLSVNVLAGPLSLLFEGKHYRRFFPLLANVSPLRAREFSTLAASAPPTTEALYTDTEFENFNTCVSGGRLRGDLALSRIVSVYSWAGYYQSFAESVANDACAVGRDTRNRILDTAVGVELRSLDRRSKMDISFGSRFDDTDRAIATDNGTTHVFYREDLHTPPRHLVPRRPMSHSSFKVGTGAVIKPWAAPARRGAKATSCSASTTPHIGRRHSASPTTPTPPCRPPTSTANSATA